MRTHLSRVLIAALLVALGGEIVLGQETIWIEGETTSATNVKPNIAGWGNKAILSQETWLHLSVDADKVDAQVPGDAAIFSYAFTTKTPASFEVWNRIGFEFARSPFE